MLVFFCIELFKFEEYWLKSCVFFSRIDVWPLGKKSLSKQDCNNFYVIIHEKVPS